MIAEKHQLFLFTSLPRYVGGCKLFCFFCTEDRALIDRLIWQDKACPAYT